MFKAISDQRQGVGYYMLRQSAQTVPQVDDDALHLAPYTLSQRPVNQSQHRHTLEAKHL